MISFKIGPRPTVSIINILVLLAFLLGAMTKYNCPLEMHTIKTSC